MKGEKMQRISKKCKTEEEASKFQEKLYNRWDIVRLIQFPWSSDGGLYVWEVK